jgi:antitoxin component of RelBE/YafQ-DinJ toxin-antitoxin module
MEQDNLVTVEFQMDSKLLEEAEKVLAEQGMTIEEALVLFCRWCAYCPAEATAAIKQWMEDEAKEEGGQCGK